MKSAATYIPYADGFSAAAYVGWDTELLAINIGAFGRAYIQQLNGGGRNVNNAVDFAINSLAPGSPPREAGQAHFQIYRGHTKAIDLSP